MSTADLVAAGSALVAAVLLCSGAAKLAVPGHTQRAVAELLAVRAEFASPIVRVLAAVEVAVAVALAWPASLRYGLAGAAVLGLVFAAAGALGAARRVRAACGCFGRDSGRPLGMRAVATGLCLLAVAAAGLLAGVTDAGAAPAVGPVLASGWTVLLAAWLYRDLIKDLVRPREERAEAPGGSR